MIVNPWPGLRHEDRHLFIYIGDYWLWPRVVITSATRLQCLYLTGAKFSDVYKTTLHLVEVILTVNIFVVSGLRARDPPRKIQLNSRQHKYK